MKTSKIKSAPFSIIIVSLISTLQVIANPRFDDTKEIELPVPGNQFSNRGSLFVEAEGNDQESVSLNYCFPTKFKYELPGSCHQSTSVSVNVKNRDLIEGQYLVRLSGSLAGQFVPVEKNTTTELKTKRLKVPMAAGNSEYRLFVDFTNVEMQEREIKFVWLTENFKRIKRDCEQTSYKSPGAKRACAAWLGSDPMKLRANFVQFDNEARIKLAYFIRWGNSLDLSWGYPHRFWIGSARITEMFSVFSGVYGIQVVDQRGFKQTKLGYQVE